MTQKSIGTSMTWEESLCLLTLISKHHRSHILARKDEGWGGQGVHLPASHP